MAEGKPTRPDQGLPGNALKNRERRRGQEKRRDPATEPTATPPPPSSGPPPKPQSDGSRLQTGPGITGGRAAAFHHLTRGAFLGEARPPGELTDAPSLGDSDPKSGWLKWLSSLPPRVGLGLPLLSPQLLPGSRVHRMGFKTPTQLPAGHRRDCSVRDTRGARGRVGVTVPARATAAAAA